jgi:hypothetical protein
MINFSRAVSVLTFIFITTASFKCLAQVSHNFQKELFSVWEMRNQKIETCIQPGALKYHRSKLNFNRDWKIQLGDHQGAEYPGFNDNKWQSIGLPHSFVLNSIFNCCMRMARTKYIVVFVLLQIVFLKQLQAFSNPPITYLGINQGLSNNSVISIYQDHKGFMWFGTFDGLNRYGGYGFKIFRNRTNDLLSGC